MLTVEVAGSAVEAKGGKRWVLETLLIKTEVLLVNAAGVFGDLDDINGAPGIVADDAVFVLLEHRVTNVARCFSEWTKNVEDSDFGVIEVTATGRAYGDRGQIKQ